ncbi:hypothetical protein M409DRAFT_59594 [Zasmidium cellare ATCC 36951]|uniref:Uncharacterized protein n=1 Tax=Zasmidium cellare ATCC 36951 TaxID=1080233 RepID=A0A6A6C4Y2_ZASCE|nr:uncharacterized protein M409DRAFT_59594 [Zasmidium cellare ATCC 36951]KAF2160799.1 hypothetical protein M409DRAFT_59594 [Zasmidium cellare ATCC 36951]
MRSTHLSDPTCNTCGSCGLGKTFSIAIDIPSSSQTRATRSQQVRPLLHKPPPFPQRGGSREMRRAVSTDEHDDEGEGEEEKGKVRCAQARYVSMCLVSSFHTASVVERSTPASIIESMQKWFAISSPRPSAKAGTQPY